MHRNDSQFPALISQISSIDITMILLLSLILPIILIYLLHKIQKTTKTHNLPPSPPPLPLIGNLHQIATAGDLHIYLWRLSRKYGPLFHMKLGSIPLLVVSSAKLAKEVLKDQDLAFCSRPKSYGMQKLTYNNSDIIFSPYNHAWRELRKITTIHLFNLKKVQSFRPVREDEVSRMITKVSDAAASHQVVNVNEMAMAFSSSLICRTAFGKKYDEHGSEMRRFDELLQDFLAITTGFFLSDYFPAIGWVDKLTGLTKKVDRTFQKLDSFYEELIDEHLDPSRIKTVGEEDDFLDILIQLEEQQKSSSVEFTRNQIKALLMNIFIAGTETTASAIGWTMTALIKAPNVMKKLQCEIRNLVGKRGKVDENDLPKLPYLKAVVNESLRLYPPAPLLVPRETLVRCTLDSYEIQAKTMVFVNAWAVARDPEYWENPEEFIPERFLNSARDVRGQDFDLIPFGSGRRMCPGMPMGLVNVELAIANLVYSLEWELPPGIRPQDVDTDPSPGLGVQKKNPLLLLPKKFHV